MIDEKNVQPKTFRVVEHTNGHLGWIRQNFRLFFFLGTLGAAFLLYYELDDIKRRCRFLRGSYKKNKRV